MKFDPKGVEAAKMMSPISKPTSKQTASGPLVINPVNVPMPLVFLRHSISISMANPMQSMLIIMPNAPMDANRKLPLKSRELPIKNTRTRIQATISRRPREFVRKFFKLIESMWRINLHCVSGNESSDIFFAYKKCTQNTFIDFQCRYHPDSVMPGQLRGSQDVDFYHLYFGVGCCYLV